MSYLASRVDHMTTTRFNFTTDSEQYEITVDTDRGGRGQVMAMRATGVVTDTRNGDRWHIGNADARAALDAHDTNWKQRC